MGPEGESPEDARLRALKAHQAALENAPTEEDLKSHDSLAKLILPLLLAQGVDLITTNKLVGTKAPVYSNPGFNRGGVESNPLPGMQSGLGRAGWAGLELAAVAALMKANPKAGEVLRNVAMNKRLELGLANQQQAEDIRVGSSPLFGWTSVPKDASFTSLRFTKR